ncbi:MAG: acyltransferase [Ktedonobacteraceae bacterium]|nr:acyltransferase [Ktedonobacteraceae bacterium]
MLLPTRIENGKFNIAVLDGARAIACLSVVGYHITWGTLNQFWSIHIGVLTSSVFLIGYSGVTLFFILSGFLLFLPYARALLFQASWPSARQFLGRRAFRTMPGYYAALFLLVVLQHTEYLQPRHLQELALFLTFQMDATRLTFQKLNGPFWTLAIEWQYYLLLPLLALFFRWIVARGSLRWRWWSLVTCLLVMIGWGVLSRYLGYYYTRHPDEILLVSRPVLNVILFFTFGTTGKYLEDFAVGMLLSCCYVLAQREHELGHLIQGIRRVSTWCWRIGILMLVFMALWNLYHRFQVTLPGFHRIFAHLERSSNGVTGFVWSSEILLSCGYGCCLLALLFGPDWLKRPFEWPILCQIGLISYSIYIWHLPLLRVFLEHVGEYTAGWNHYLVLGLCCLFVPLVVLPFSHMMYRSIELPWIRAGSRLLATKPSYQPEGHLQVSVRSH